MFAWSSQAEKQSGTVVVTPDVGHATSALREPRRNVPVANGMRYTAAPGDSVAERSQAALTWQRGLDRYLWPEARIS